MSGEHKSCDRQTLSRLMDGDWAGLDVPRQLGELEDNAELCACWSRYHLVRDVMRKEVFVAGTSLVEQVQAALADEPAHSNVHSLERQDNDAQLDAASAIASGTQGPPRLDAEAGVDQQRRSGVWGRWAGGMGIAACAAALTVFGLNRDDSSSTPLVRAEPTLAVSTAQAEIEQEQTSLVASGLIGNATSSLVSIGGVEALESVGNRGSFWVVDGGARSPSEAQLNRLLSNHLSNTRGAASVPGLGGWSPLLGYDEPVSDFETTPVVER